MERDMYSSVKRRRKDRAPAIPVQHRQNVTVDYSPENTSNIPHLLICELNRIFVYVVQIQMIANNGSLEDLATHKPPNPKANALPEQPPALPRLAKMCFDNSFASELGFVRYVVDFCFRTQKLSTEIPNELKPRFQFLALELLESFRLTVAEVQPRLQDVLARIESSSENASSGVLVEGTATEVAPLSVNVPNTPATTTNISSAAISASISTEAPSSVSSTTHDAGPITIDNKVTHPAPLPRPPPLPAPPVFSPPPLPLPPAVVARLETETDALWRVGRDRIVAAMQNAPAPAMPYGQGVITREGRGARRTRATLEEASDEELMDESVERLVGWRNREGGREWKVKFFDQRAEEYVHEDCFSNIKSLPNYHQALANPISRKRRNNGASSDSSMDITVQAAAMAATQALSGIITNPLGSFSTPSDSDSSHTLGGNSRYRPLPTQTVGDAMWALAAVPISAPQPPAPTPSPLTAMTDRLMSLNPRSVLRQPHTLVPSLPLHPSPLPPTSMSPSIVPPTPALTTEYHHDRRS